MQLNFKWSRKDDPVSWPEEGAELKILFCMPSFGLDSIEIAEAIVTHRNEENDMNGQYCIIKTDIGYGDEIDASEIDFLYMPSNNFLEEACKELGMKFEKSEWKQGYGAMDEVVVVRNSKRKE